MTKKSIDFLHDFRILFIKTFLLTLRKPTQTIIEIFLAYIFMGMLLGLRYILDRQYYQEYRLPRFRPQDTLLVNGTGNIIYYYPGNICATMIVRGAVNDLIGRWPAFPNNTQILSDPSLSSASDATLNSIFAFIYFTNLDSCTNSSTMPDEVRYTLRMQENGPYYYHAQSVKINANDYLWKHSPEEFCQATQSTANYINRFLGIQYSIDISIIKYVTNTSQYILSNIYMNHFGCPELYIDQLQSVYSFFIPIFFSIIYLVTFIMNVGYIVKERENKIKEFLRIYGLRTWINNLVWIIRSMIIYMILTIVVTGLSLIQLPKSNTSLSISKAVFNYTHWFLLWIILFVYAIQVSTFSVLFGQFFNRPLLAKLIGVIVWIFTFIDFYAGVPLVVRYLLCLFPNTGLMFCLQVLLQYERKSSGITTIEQIYSNLFSYKLYIGICLLMMFIYSIVYFLLSIYIERINPGEFGIAQPWYYPLRISYWKAQAIESVQQTSFIRKEKYNHWIESSSTMSRKHSSVSIRNLTKKFGDFQAVSNLSLEFYEGEVCSLLGHNGAGKTTTTFILVGMLQPTSGSVLIEGLDIQKNLSDVRKLVGFCPQYDILYDELTVEEHFELIGRLRHIQSNHLKESIENILHLIDLINDRQTFSKDLSGGMKRRLSIGISLISDPKILILDEPTSGIDPNNRRLIWTIIQKMKQANKCIILTTHFLEEVDLLSDRIAIMTNGQLQAQGRPEFLKNQLDFQYRLFIDKHELFSNQKIINFIRKYIPTIRIEYQSTNQLILNIKHEDSQGLVEFIEVFESQSQWFGIQNYGITMKTIEDVFLKLIHETEEQKGLNPLRDQLVEKVFHVQHERVSDFHRYYLQMFGLICKRYHVLRRQYIFLFGFFLLPLLIEILLVSILPTPQQILSSLIDNDRIPNAQITLLPSIYNSQTIVIYVNNDNLRTQFIESHQSSLITIEDISIDNVLNYVRQRYLQTEEIFLNEYQIGFALYNNNNSLIINSYFSTVNYHTMATSLGVSTTNLFQFYGNSSRKQIITTNQPILTSSTNFPMTEIFLELLYCFDTIPLSLFNFLNSILGSICLSILLVSIIHERIHHAKDLQLLTNLSKKIYWFANVLFDFSLCSFLSILLTIIVKLGSIFNKQNQSEVHIYINSIQMGYFFLLFILYTGASLPFIYVYSFVSKSGLLGFLNFFILNILACFLDMIFAFISVFSQGQSTNVQLLTNLSLVMNQFRLIISILFPSVNLKHALFNIRLKSDANCVSILNSIMLTNYSIDESWISVREPALGLQIVIFLGQMSFWWIVLISIENRKEIQRWFEKKTDENESWDDCHLDEDVQTERQLILHENVDSISSVLVVRDLVRIFHKRLFRQPFLAVDHLNFQVTKRSCFGLLGTNGAGKTTTFRMLINDLKATSGEIYINRKNLNRMQNDLDIGFCPQFDWLIDHLTVLETLILYARLKGLKSSAINEICTDIIEIFHLNSYTQRRVGKLSGGNKRKLSTAIAFLANPALVLLDEPTTGLDAAAKRKLWNVIRSARDIGLTIIMTSHSMEECEALCTKIGIMKSGQFVCLGNLQRLKHRFGYGYNVRIKVHLRYLNRLKKELISILPGIEIDEQSNGIFYCTIPLSFHLAYLFDIFHEKQSNNFIEYYSISSTTLEQIFVQVTDEMKETLV